MHSPSAPMDALVEGFQSSFAAENHGDMPFYGPLASLPVLLLALAVWFIEWRQRTKVGVSTREDGATIGTVPLRPARLLFQLIPEIVVLALCAMVATAVILRSENNGSSPKDHVEEKVWDQINKEWPILMTADTLLALQAMIRLVLCLSATLRPREMDVSPFANEPVAFFLLASVSRVTLLVLSPWDWWHVDGPLGGKINFGFELAALPLMIYLSRGMLYQGLFRMVLLATGLAVACGAAWCNRFMISEPGFAYMDWLFSLTHVLEFLAASTFLARTIVLNGESGGAFTSFAHMLLPVQQSFSMYFLLTAFAPPLQVIPELVGAGRPFEVLEIAGLAQVGMFLFAAALHVAFVASKETKEVEPYLQTGLQLAKSADLAMVLNREGVLEV